jgi:hypothetical protein
MKKLYFIAVFAAIIGSSSTAWADTGDLINIRFVPNNAVPAYTGEAVCGLPGQTWNSYDSDNSTPPISLQLANGNASSAFVTVNYDTIASINKKSDLFYGTPDDPLMKYYAQTSNTVTPATVEFTGLDRKATYTLFLYSQKATDSTSPSTTFVVNGSNFTVTNTNTSAFFISDSNYVEISGVQSDAFGNLSFGFLPGPYATTGALSGIQLLQNTIGAVPEPNTVALLGIGGLLLRARTFFQRKKRNVSDAV